MKTIIISLTLLFVACSQVSFIERDIASVDLSSIKITDCKLPLSSVKNEMQVKVSSVNFTQKEEVVARLKLLFNCINTEIVPSVDFPKKLFLSVRDDNTRSSRLFSANEFITSSPADMLNNNKYSVINVSIDDFQKPQINTIDKTVIAAAHEYGHYIFYLNTFKRSKNINAVGQLYVDLRKENFLCKQNENKLRNFRRSFVPIYIKNFEQKCPNLIKPRIGLNLNLFYNCIEVHDPELYRNLIQEEQRLEDEMDTCPRRIHEKANDVFHIFFSQNELFADLVAILHFENPSVMLIVDRDFSEKNFSIATHTDLRVHDYYAPIRNEVWRLYLKSKMTKGEFLNRVLNAMILNYEDAKKDVLNVQKNNRMLLKAIAKEVL